MLQGLALTIFPHIFRFSPHRSSPHLFPSLSLSPQDKKCRGEIQIGVTTSIDLPRVVHKDSPEHMFYITDPKRSTAVCAPSKEIMAAWMTILRKACAGGITKR